ncbi:dormancy-associated protein 2-like [Vigna unguiculata]|uniref:Glycine rich protein n=1 Tax=Vigna unguiculata TaxID=3917 RepID=A0A4D6MKV8_VIGUN|nr:dormancy-associated protein 2-like [Vigna unguiculata]QCE01414.1 hypothetical protein DEO72_LG7g2711 [Vigna unguiculata]
MASKRNILSLMLSLLVIFLFVFSEVAARELKDLSGRDRGGFNRDSRLFWGGFPNFYGGYGGYGGYFNNPFDPRYSFGQGRGFPFNPPFGNGVFNNPFGGGFNTGTGGGFVGGIPNIGGGVRVP